MLEINSRIANGYKQLVKGCLTGQEYFIYFYGMLDGLNFTGNNINTQKQLLRSLEQEYRNIPQDNNRDITAKEQEILNRLKEV